MTNKEIHIKTLNIRISKCRKCEGLNMPEETPSAPGNGSLNSVLIVVGQSLHSYNRNTNPQIPFVGPIPSKDSGIILFDVLEKTGLQRPPHSKDVFLTNTVHCHTPKNRAPSDLEIENCARFLKNEILTVKPKAILLLGNTARKTFFTTNQTRLGKKFKIDCAISTMHSYPKVYIFPFIYAPHPSWIQRFGSDRIRQQYIDELSQIIRGVIMYAAKTNRELD